MNHPKSNNKAVTMISLLNFESIKEILIMAYNGHLVKRQKKCSLDI